MAHAGAWMHAQHPTACLSPYINSQLVRTRVQWSPFWRLDSLSCSTRRPVAAHILWNSCQRPSSGVVNPSSGSNFNYRSMMRVRTRTSVTAGYQNLVHCAGAQTRPWTHGPLAMDVDVVDRTKEREKANQKANQKGKKQAKEIPRARKEVVQKWHMASAPTAMNTVIGHRTAPTWWIKSSRNPLPQMLQLHRLINLQPKFQAVPWWDGFFSLEALLQALHPQYLHQLPKCLWFCLTTWTMIGHRFQMILVMVNGWSWMPGFSWGAVSRWLDDLQGQR